MEPSAAIDICRKGKDQIKENADPDLIGIFNEEVQ